MVDFHGEASSEKQGIGFFCDGRASLVVGTHTHVPTADHQILSGGTAYMTDAGMTGDYDSIIGMQKEEPLRRFTSGIPSGRFEPALGAATLSGVAVETDDATGLALQDRAGADRRQAGAGAAGILVNRPRDAGRAGPSRSVSVMAGLVPAIHVFFTVSGKGRRGCPGQAGHADKPGSQDCRMPIRKAPQWRPRTWIGAERSFIRTKLPPPMSRR